jgi:hypothetical protein
MFISYKFMFNNYKFLFSMLLKTLKMTIFETLQKGPKNAPRRALVRDPKNGLQTPQKRCFKGKISPDSKKYRGVPVRPPILGLFWHFSKIALI